MQAMGISPMPAIRESNAQQEEAEERDQPMNNKRLGDRSETFDDDNGTRIDKRCYVLAIGDDDV